MTSAPPVGGGALAKSIEQDLASVPSFDTESCPDELCHCDGGGATATDIVLRRARRLLNLIIEHDVWTTLDEAYLPSIVWKAEDLGDLIAIAQHPSRRRP